MELSKQVVSLELAKRMKELGFEQESLWYWIKKGVWTGFKAEDKFVIEQKIVSDGTTQIAKYNLEHYSAYTVAELGEIYRSNLDNMKHLVINVTREKNRQLIYRIFKGWASHTECEDRAKMLIYLKENNLLQTT